MRGCRGGSSGDGLTAAAVIQGDTTDDAAASRVREESDPIQALRHSCTQQPACASPFAVIVYPHTYVAISTTSTDRLPARCSQCRVTDPEKGEERRRGGDDDVGQRKRG